MTLLTDRRTFLLGTGVAAAGLVTGCSSESAPMPAAPPSDDGGLVRLNLRENPWGPSPKAIEAIAEHARKANRYAGGEKEALIGFLAEANGVKPEQVVLGNGSKPILAATGALFARGGGELVTTEQTYNILYKSAEVFGATLVHVPLTESWDWDFAQMRTKLGPETCATYLCNPNGGTGRLIDPDALRAFVIEAAKVAPVFVDEAYLDMSPDFPANSMAPLVAEGHDVIVSRTLSKMHGLAGARLGYAMGPEARVEEIHALLTNHVNLGGLVSGLASLEDLAYQEEMREAFAVGRARLMGIVTDHGLTAIPAPMHNGVHFDLGYPTARFHEQMMADGILVGKGDEEKTWTSICVGTEAEMDRFAMALGRALSA